MSPSSRSKVKVARDADGNPCVHYPGDYNILVPGHRDIDYRQRVLEDQGVTTQVLSFTTPGVHVESPAVAVEWARLVNDAFAQIVRERGGRFRSLATLPSEKLQIGRKANSGVIGKSQPMPAVPLIEFQRAGSTRDSTPLLATKTGS